MKRRFSLGFLILMIALVIAGGAGSVSQWREAISLRAELELAQVQASELERLRGENKRLRDQQIPAAELELLRADHAALPRLRAGIDPLNKH